MNQTLLQRIRQNPFSKESHYSVSLFMKSFKSQYHFYAESYFQSRNLFAEKMTAKEIIQHMTPEFQRSNDKWTHGMKVSFVENVIAGYRPQILFYSISDGTYDDSLILDGLQRSTALAEFIDGDYSVFDGFYFDDLKSRLHKPIDLKIFHFNSHLEACEFYIKMNKNITHSPADLQKAVDYINKEKAK